MRPHPLHSHGHAVARKVTAFADPHPVGGPGAGSPCAGQIANQLPGSGGVWDPTWNNHTGAYIVNYNGVEIDGFCQNVDGQSCGNDSVMVNGKCTSVAVNLGDTAISGNNQKVYETWVKNYYILMDAVLKQYETDGVTLGNQKVDAKFAKAMSKYLGKERAKMLAQIKSGHAPAVFFKAVAQNSGDSALYSGDLGGLPNSTVMFAARDGGVPPAAAATLGQDPEGISALKALNSNFARAKAASAPKNPFPSRSAPPVFTTPSRKPTPGVSAANVPSSDWWNHDAMASGNQAAIAASNANANADLQNAINTGHLLDSAIAAGSVAYGGPYQSSDPEIPPAAGPEPVGNMAPQVQPGSGSQYTPPPAPVYQMTGFEPLSLDVKSLVPIGIAFFLLYCLSKRK